jgi:hypothetical protein
VAIRKDYLKLLKQLERYKKRQGGRWVYDLRRAEEELPLFKKYGLVSGRPGTSKIKPPIAMTTEPSTFFYKLRKKVRQKYLRVMKPENHPVGFIEAKEVFGRTEGTRGYNALCEELTGLILHGEDFEKHKRRLRRTYHLKTARDKKDPQKILFDELKELWDWISKDIQELRKKMSPREVRAWEEMSDASRQGRQSASRQAPKPKPSRGKEITPEEYKKKFGYYPTTRTER